jgi:prepilin-type N-terminal cleavage/methylation domain-containing protein
VNQHRGFSLVELVCVMVIVGILATTVSSRFMSNSVLQLQAGRDQLISSLFVAQQKAMTQFNAVRLITSGSSIDIRVDLNDDGSFAAGESIAYGGTQYPLTVPGGVSFNAVTLTYDRRGYVAPSSITATKGADSVVVTISGTGYAY